MGNLRQNIRQDRFTGPMYRRLWAPAMVSSLGWALSDMADAVVVGQRLGTVGLAAIGLILPVYMVNCMMAHGLGLGGSVRYSRLLGEGRPEEAGESFAQVFWMAVLLSCLTAAAGSMFLTPLLALLGTTPADGALFAATRDYLEILVAATPLFYLSNLLNYYLRNDGSQHRAGVGSVVGNLSDIALNVLLVLVFDMGTRGAALSTALGQVITIAIYLPGFFRPQHVLRFALPRRGWLGPGVSALRAGLATSVQYLYQMIFFLLCNNLLIRMGGEDGVAVFDVLQNTSYLILYLYEGTARAMQPILSTYQGEHNQAGCRSMACLGFGSGIAVGGALILLVECWPEGMCLLFGIGDSATRTLACLALRIYGLGAFFAGINILLCNYYQARGQEKAAFVLETLRGAVLLLPFTLLCARLGLRGFWWLFPATEMIALAAFGASAFSGRYSREEIPAERVFQRTILSNTRDVGEVCQELEAFCRSWDASARQCYFTTMTLEELSVAILQHGFTGRTDGYIQITAIAQPNGEFELHLRDDAETFNPFSLETQRAGADQEFDMDSMGVFVIKRQAKEFFYRRYQGFNTLTVKI